MSRDDDPDGAAIEQRLSDLEERCREVEAVARVGSWDWHLPSDHVRWSEELYRIFGLKPDHFSPTYEAYLDRLHPDDRGLARTMVEHALARHDSFEGDLRVVLPAGPIRWIHARGRVTVDGDGEPVWMVGTVQDITDQRELLARLTQEATVDPLTGLPNRLLATDRLEHALGRRGTVTAVAYLDIDDFKRVNDDLGHEAGDRVLVAVADELRRSMRVGDTVARIGGDEFVVVCEDLIGDVEVPVIAERVVRRLEVDVGDDRPLLMVTASVGLAVAVAGTAADEVLRSADAAMYRAKRRGRGLLEIDDQAPEET